MNKYRNKKTTVNGITFDSQREAKRWQELQLMESAGLIRNLERQVKFELVPAVKLNGKTKRAMTYVADFIYYDFKTHREIVEDSKGYITDLFRAKQHLMKSVHGIDILLT